MGQTEMRNDQPAKKTQPLMLERYLSGDNGQLDVQGRLVLGAPAPSDAQKTAEMGQKLARLSEKLGNLDQAPVTNVSRYPEMTQDLNSLPRRG